MEIIWLFINPWKSFVIFTIAIGSKGNTILYLFVNSNCFTRYIQIYELSSSGNCLDHHASVCVCMLIYIETHHVVHAVSTLALVFKWKKHAWNVCGRLAHTNTSSTCHTNTSSTCNGRTCGARTPRVFQDTRHALLPPRVHIAPGAPLQAAIVGCLPRELCSDISVDQCEKSVVGWVHHWIWEGVYLWGVFNP